MQRLHTILAWLGKLIVKDSFAALALCALLVLAQYHVNTASRLGSECDQDRSALMMLRMTDLETSLIRIEGRLIALDGRVMAHDAGLAPPNFDGPEAKAAREANANLERVRQGFEAGHKQWEQACEYIDDYKDLNVLLMAAISAMLTFLGFQLGKHSRRPE